MEPLLERFGTLRMKAVSDPFRERPKGFVVLRLPLLTLALKLLDGKFLRTGN